MIPIELSPRQHQIVAYVRANEPATGDSIAAHLKLTRATIRADLSILTMTGILDARPKSWLLLLWFRNESNSL